MSQVAAVFGEPGCLRGIVAGVRQDACIRSVVNDRN
jgi:hypothetical protein